MNTLLLLCITVVGLCGPLPAAAKASVDPRPPKGVCYFDPATQSLVFSRGLLPPPGTPPAAPFCSLRPAGNVRSKRARAAPLCNNVNVGLVAGEGAKRVCQCTNDMALSEDGVCAIPTTTVAPPPAADQNPAPTDETPAPTDQNPAPTDEIPALPVDNDASATPPPDTEPAAATAAGVAAAAAAAPCRVGTYSGTCISTTACTSSGGGSVPGYCTSAPASIQCCVNVPCSVSGVAAKCKSSLVAGQCASPSRLTPGYCSVGPSSFQCCVNVPPPETWAYTYSISTGVLTGQSSRGTKTTMYGCAGTKAPFNCRNRVGPPVCCTAEPPARDRYNFVQPACNKKCTDTRPCEQQKAIGPLPRGKYTIGTRNNGIYKNGVPIYYVLNQVSGNTYNRGDFRIHGGDCYNSESWTPSGGWIHNSEGCIMITDDAQRASIKGGLQGGSQVYLQVVD